MKRRNLVSDVLVVDSAVPTSSPLEGIGTLLAVPFLVIERRTFRDYRTWTLQQLALATEYVLGSEEPMLAGETALHRGFFGGRPTRDLAITVTDGHVVVFRIDSIDGQPSSIALAARSSDVKLEAHMLFRAQPSLVITRGSEQVTLRGYPRVFQPGAVLDAWRRSALPR